MMNTKKNKHKRTIKDKFFDLLNKAIQPLVPEGDETQESQTDDNYTDKQTHQHLGFKIMFSGYLVYIVR